MGKGEIELRPLQVKAWNDLRQGFGEGHKRQMLYAPCGWGKSYTTVKMMMESYRKTGKKSYFVADRTVLIDKMHQDSIEKSGLPVGVMRGDSPYANPYAPIQICTIQTLAARGFPDDCGLIVIDEAHVWHRSHDKMLEKCSDTPVIGMSATPLTKGLGKRFSNLVIGGTMRQMIEEGNAVDIVAYSVKPHDLRELRSGSDYHTKKLSKYMSNVKLVGEAVDHYIELGQDRLFMCFCVDIDHSKVMMEKFNQKGIRTAHIDGYMDREERKDILASLREGYYRGVTSVGCLSYGTDIPEVSCGILARPVRSLMAHIQMLGRLSRAYPGKDYALILDNSGNMRMFPSPKDFHVYSLDDEEKGSEARVSKAKPAKYCDECGCERKGLKCDECGYTIEITPRDKVKVKDGKLEILNGKEMLDLRKSNFSRMAIAYCNEKGKDRRHWVWLYKERFGAGPEFMPSNTLEPTPKFRDYIKHIYIKNAKRKR